MKDSECVAGTKVICVMKVGAFVGMTGYLCNVVRHENGNHVRHYSVEDARGFLFGTGHFSFLTSWEVCISEAPKTLKSVTHMSKECPCGISRDDCNYHK